MCSSYEATVCICQPSTVYSTSLHDLDYNYYAMQIQATKKGSIMELMKLLDGGHDPNLCEESKVCTALCDISYFNAYSREWQK